MKFTILTVCLLLAVVGKSHQIDAEACDDGKCSISDNCRCSSLKGPIALDETPQLIVLAFLDAAKEDIYTNRWNPMVNTRKNPDGEFISASFYINHEYSNYQIVHDLAVYGMEIGVHSVTNNADQNYWRNASQELLEQEFGDQRKIISKFANIPLENIQGSLTPQFQLAGDNSISAFVSQGFSYDSSWPSRDSYYPYTLEYLSNQDCDLGAVCPTQSYPGFWITPIIDLVAEDGDVCNTLSACFRKDSRQTKEDISNWLFDFVEDVKTTNRAPLTLIIEENFFLSVNAAWEGLTDALDRIQEDQDVFLVSHARVIEWIKNPVPIADFTTSLVTVDTGCVKSTCNLKNSNGTTMPMISCVQCPDVYPWLGNPEGTN